MSKDEASGAAGISSPDVSADDGIADTAFEWTVPVSINNFEEKLLGPSDKIVPEDASIPREIIAQEVSGTRVLARLTRPLHIGMYEGNTAYLLCFELSFQLRSPSSRIRHATITITFDDAPAEDEAEDSEAESIDSDTAISPAILKFYPVMYEGPASPMSIEASSSLSVSVPGAGVVPVSSDVSWSKKKAWKEEGKLTVHGMSMGRPVEDQIVWQVTENSVSKDGIPRIMKFALIVGPQDRRRFSARLVLNASYGIRRGLLAAMVPIIGKEEEPIHFDPVTLDRMAKQKETSRYGRRIVAIAAGDLTKYDLSEHSSFRVQMP